MWQPLQIIPNPAGCPHQGAILSPLLYSIFVDDLLNTLDFSNLCSRLGAKIGEVFCGAPIYADDLALMGSSPEELLAMLGIVSHYTALQTELLQIRDPRI